MQGIIQIWWLFNWIFCSFVLVIHFKSVWLLHSYDRINIIDLLVGIVLLVFVAMKTMFWNGYVVAICVVWIIYRCCLIVIKELWFDRKLDSLCFKVEYDMFPKIKNNINQRFFFYYEYKKKNTIFKENKIFVNLQNKTICSNCLLFNGLKATCYVKQFIRKIKNVVLVFLLKVIKLCKLYSQFLKSLQNTLFNIFIFLVS